MEDKEVTARKKELRKRLRQARKDLGSEARERADAGIASRVLSLSEWQRSQIVLVYLSVGEEVDTRGLVRQAWVAGKVVAIPRVVPHTRLMEWYRIDDFDRLERSSFGVEEPLAEPDRLLDVAREAEAGGSILAVVPGLTFDGHGFRMGYGGGFYDTLLTDFSGTSVGICREAQLTDNLAAMGVVGEHDLGVDVVVTERRTIETSESPWSNWVREKEGQA